MSDTEKHLAHLSEIKSIMQRSSQFLSLSGLSGIAAGIIALIGAGYAYYLLDFSGGSYESVIYEMDYTMLWRLIGIAMAVLICAAIAAFVFTKRKTDREGEALWNATTKKLITNLMIPLMTGGVFCLMLIVHGFYILLAPATLLFYGLACVNASHFTLRDIKYLGISEIILGLLNCFFLGNGILFWAVGFGLLHIVYGGMMYYKYDRTPS